jgi:hypothetical protein
MLLGLRCRKGAPRRSVWWTAAAVLVSACGHGPAEAVTLLEVFYAGPDQPGTVTVVRVSPLQEGTDRPVVERPLTVQTAPVPTIEPGVPAEAEPDEFHDGLPVGFDYELAAARYRCPPDGCPPVTPVDSSALEELGEAQVGCREELRADDSRRTLRFELRYSGDRCEFLPLDEG